MLLSGRGVALLDRVKERAPGSGFEHVKERKELDHVSAPRVLAQEAYGCRSAGCEKSGRQQCGGRRPTRDRLGQVKARESTTTPCSERPAGWDASTTSVAKMRSTTRSSMPIFASPCRSSTREENECGVILSSPTLHPP